MAKLPSTYEKKWPTIIITPIQVVAGKIVVNNTKGLHTKQSIVLSKVGEAPFEAEIKRILSDVEFYVGPKNQNIKIYFKHSELIDYDGGTLTMSEQNRNPIASEYVLRAVYEEEPAVALRVLSVDPHGQYYDEDNPLPVEIKDAVIDANLNVQLTHLDDSPNVGDVHDSVRIGDGINLAEVTAKEELRTVDTLHCGGVNKVIEVFDTPVKVEVISGTPKIDRKTIFVQPRAKGIYWGFNSDVDKTDGPKGGSPLGKNQPLKISAESNTPVYLVGSASGIKVFILEA